MSRVPVSEGKVAPPPPSSHPLQPHPPPPHDTRTSVNTNQLVVYLTTFLYAQIILCFTKRDVYRTFGTFYLPFSFSPLPYFLSFPFSSPSSHSPQDVVKTRRTTPTSIRKTLSSPPATSCEPIRGEDKRGTSPTHLAPGSPHTGMCMCAHTVMFSTAL